MFVYLVGFRKENTDSKPHILTQGKEKRDAGISDFQNAEQF